MSPSGHDLLTSSAVHLAGLIRERECSSREVVEAHIEQVRLVNPRLNALVAERYDRARQEADAADARLRGTPTEQRAALPPLLGVPCTIKSRSS